MAIKKYLTTPEEILALKDTDTKIYTEGDEGYHQFIQGTLFHFYNNDSFTLFSGFGIGNGFVRKYILVEKPISNVTEKDIGKMCWFFDEDEDSGNYGILKYIMDGKFYINGVLSYSNCRRLTLKEIIELTNYKTEE